MMTKAMPCTPHMGLPTKRTQDAREVFVFIPFDTAGKSPEYDTAAFRAELADWFTPLKLKWRWVGITLKNIEAVVAITRQHAVDHELVVFNLCDGDELDGCPGHSVIAAIEGARLCFTGADSAFYRISSSKLAMKAALAHAGILTPPHVEMKDLAGDLSKVGNCVATHA